MKKQNQTTAFERAQLYRELHRDFIDRFNKTRDIEWIINAALWTAIIFVGYGLYGHVSTGSIPWWLFFVLPPVAWLVHFGLWMFAIQTEEDIDQHRAEGYRVLVHLALEDQDLAVLHKSPKELQATLEDSVKNLPDHPYRARFQEPIRFYGGIRWSIIECAVTAVLILVVILLLEFIPYQPIAMR